MRRTDPRNPPIPVPARDHLAPPKLDGTAHIPEQDEREEAPSWLKVAVALWVIVGIAGLCVAVGVRLVA